MIASTYTIQSFDNRADWLAARRTMIGASETAGIFGVGYANQSPITIWNSKVGGPEQEIEPAALKRMNLGTRMEPVIAEMFAEETKLPGRDPGLVIVRHPEIDWLGASLDREAWVEEGGWVPAEIKNVNGRFRQDWNANEEPPMKYMVQLQHQLAVTGAPFGFLVGLIGGDELVWRMIERNARFIEKMIARLRDFWGYVQRREMPPVDGSEATKAMLGLIYPKDSGDEVSLPPEATEWDRELIEVKESIKSLEGQKTELENKLRAAIGNASAGILPFGGAYTWRWQQRAEHVVKASEFRVLRRSNK